MSNMLEQAIVDAEALKEAALQNAEQAVIEKYQAEIKQAVESLLEQDEELPLDDEEGMMMGDEEELESSEDLAQQLPLAANDGEKLCACPDEEEELEVDMEQLAQQMAASEEGEMGGPLAGDMDMALEEGVEAEETLEEEEFEFIDPIAGY